MELSDILGMVLVIGPVFFIIGYKTKTLKIKKMSLIRRLLGSPQFLKSEGYLTHTSQNNNANKTRITE